MGTILDRLPEASRVAIIRLRSMGDSVLTTPALHILKQTRPDLKIAVVVEDRFCPSVWKAIRIWRESCRPVTAL